MTDYETLADRLGLGNADEDDVETLADRLGLGGSRPLPSGVRVVGTPDEDPRRRDGRSDYPYDVTD